MQLQHQQRDPQAKSEETRAARLKRAGARPCTSEGNGEVTSNRGCQTTRGTLNCHPGEVLITPASLVFVVFVVVFVAFSSIIIFKPPHFSDSVLSDRERRGYLEKPCRPTTARGRVMSAVVAIDGFVLRIPLTSLALGWGSFTVMSVMLCCANACQLESSSGAGHGEKTGREGLTKRRRPCDAHWPRTETTRSKAS